MLRLRALTTNAAGQLDVLRHDGDALGVDGAEVNVLEEANEICLGRLLEGEDRCGLEAKVLQSEISDRQCSTPFYVFEVLGDLAHKALEGQLADEEVGGLAVAADLLERHGARHVLLSFCRGGCSRR